MDGQLGRDMSTSRSLKRGLCPRELVVNSGLCHVYAPLGEPGIVNKMVLAQHFCRGYSGTTQPNTKWFWPSIFAEDTQAQHNLTPAVDWLHGWVGSGGLLLVVS